MNTKDLQELITQVYNDPIRNRTNYHYSFRKIGNLSQFIVDRGSGAEVLISTNNEEYLLKQIIVAGVSTLLHSLDVRKEEGRLIKGE